jgi:Family of unknown function (DUF5947)
MEERISIPQDTSPAFEEALGVLRQFRGVRRFAQRDVEHCEFCSAELHHEHPHLVELASRQLLCACDACALLFDGKEQSKYKRVSRRVLSLSSVEITEGQWDSLIIPIDLAFFFRSSLEGRTIAFYPSPAGAVESLLTLKAWNAIVDGNPVLRGMQADIEALLVNRVGMNRMSSADVPGKAEYFIAPMDECYKLVGLIRANWKGLAGGTEVWEAINGFFVDLRAKSTSVNGDANA